MIRIAYQASHEQFSPSYLLQLVQLAEAAGFEAIHSSDHFHPWSERQGQSGFSFAWMGAAMQATRLPFSMVCAPGQRYHPAIAAQAIATLGEMFPGRFGVNLGSGEAINEGITGDKWPDKETRNRRLDECVSIIRRLLAGETVTYSGQVQVEGARLYTLPPITPPLFGAAISGETARRVGGWADGLVTINGPDEKLKAVVDAFRQGGGAGKPMHLKMDVSYARDETQALEGAYDQWRTNIFSSAVLSDIARIAQLDEIGDFVTREDVRQHVVISSDMQRFADEIMRAEKLGFEQIILHNVNRDQETFIRDLGAALPILRGK